MIAFGCLALLLTGIGTGCQTRPVPQIRCEYRQTHMGMPFRVVLYAADQASGDVAAAAAFQRISDLNRILSDYEADSELSRLSKTSGTGAVVPLSADLARVLERAQEVSRMSGGAFDITVGPLVDVWKRARRQRVLPEEYSHNTTLLFQLRVPLEEIRLPLPELHRSQLWKHASHGGVASMHSLPHN